MPKPSDPSQPPPIVAKMTSEEQAVIFPVLGMLRPFKAALLDLGRDPVRTTRQVAEELFGFIPERLAGSMVALDDLTKKHGKDALELIGQEFATERWVGVVSDLSELIKENYTSE